MSDASGLSKHEAVCAERWSEIRRQLSEVKDGIRGLWKLVVLAAGALICGMGGLIVTLTLRGH